VICFITLNNEIVLISKKNLSFYLLEKCSDYKNFAFAVDALGLLLDIFLFASVDGFLLVMSEVLIAI